MPSLYNNSGIFHVVTERTVGYGELPLVVGGGLVVGYGAPLVGAEGGRRHDLCLPFNNARWLLNLQDLVTVPLMFGYHGDGTIKGKGISPNPQSGWWGYLVAGVSRRYSARNSRQPELSFPALHALWVALLDHNLLVVL
jgi:hypothetical protein